MLRREENPYASRYSPVWLPYQFCAPLYTEERQQHHFNGYRESESYGNWLATISWWVVWVWGISLYILLPAKRRLSTGVVSPSVCLSVCHQVQMQVCSSLTFAMVANVVFNRYKHMSACSLRYCSTAELAVLVLFESAVLQDVTLLPVTWRHQSSAADHRPASLCHWPQHNQVNISICQNIFFNIGEHNPTFWWKKFTFSFDVTKY